MENSTLQPASSTPSALAASLRDKARVQASPGKPAPAAHESYSTFQELGFADSGEATAGVPAATPFAPLPEPVEMAWIQERLGLAGQRTQFQLNTSRLRWVPRLFRGLARKALDSFGRLIGGQSLQQTEFNGMLLTLCQNLCSTYSLCFQSLRTLESDLRQQECHLRQQERRLTMFLEEARKRLPGSLTPQQGQQLADEAGHALDPRYLDFEDRFRGSREEIRKRLQVYLPILHEALGDVVGRAVLDIGCGRGEWLELVRDHGWQGRGVDSNRAMVAECQRRNLEVVEDQALNYLRGLPDSSLAAVTAFHVVEHLPSHELLALLHETTRVLRPGGVAIFETPNPENLITGACTFYRDPTHLRPLHPETLHFLVEQHGLVRVKILRLNKPHGCPPLDPLPGHHPLAGHLNPLLELTRLHLLGPLDYAVVGHKTGG